MIRRLASWAGRLLGAALIGIVGAALLVELALQVASLMVAGDPAARLTAAPDRIVVLCAGDSHTWGRGKGYPAALAKRLGKRSRRYQVVNLGVPGSNTAELRRRFPGWLDTFQPAVVVVWSGVNNLSNRTDTDVWEQQAGVAPLPLWRRVLETSRLWRFVRWWRHQAALERALPKEGVLFAPALYRNPNDPTRTFRRELPGGMDLQHHENRADQLTPEEVVRVTALDVRWLAQTARARGIPMVVVTYPISYAGFVPVNEGIERGAAEAGIPVVHSSEAGGRLVAREGPEVQAKLLDKSIHPTQILYDEVGAMILEVFDERGWLPAPNAPRKAGAKGRFTEPNVR
jgi:hypothetical protein